MKGVNKAILVGNLGDDPTAGALQSGKATSKISVATKEVWRDKQTGESKESTEWHRVLMYDRLAEIANQYLTKGSAVYIEGKIQTRKWQDKDGNDRYTTEIVAREMQMLSGKPKEDGGSRERPRQEEPEISEDIPF